MTRHLTMRILKRRRKKTRYKIDVSLVVGPQRIASLPNFQYPHKRANILYWFPLPIRDWSDSFYSKLLIFCDMTGCVRRLQWALIVFFLHYSIQWAQVIWGLKLFHQWISSVHRYWFIEDSSSSTHTDNGEKSENNMHNIEHYKRLLFVIITDNKPIFDDSKS